MADQSKSRKPNGAKSTTEVEFDLDFAGLTLQELALESAYDTHEESVYSAQTVDECMSRFPFHFHYTVLTEPSS